MIKQFPKIVIISLVAIFALGGFTLAYSGYGSPKVVVEGNYIEAPSAEKELGAIAGTDVYQEMNFYAGLKYRDVMTTIAPATNTAVTLLANESGSTYLLSATGTTITLPALAKGLNFKFVINGAADTNNFVVASAEGDNIDGTLIVAGAVVDCRGEDFINFITDGEAEGDYVEVYSDGTQWLIGDSGVLTTAKMTCTDPS